MKNTLYLLLFLFAISTSFAQDPIKKGEKATITYFDFDFAPGFYGNTSKFIVSENGDTTFTLVYFLRALEQRLNEEWAVELVPAVIDDSKTSTLITVKCYPKLKTKDAIKDNSIDKIIEVRCLMMESDGFSVGAGPLSVGKSKPYMQIKVLVKDHNGKTIFESKAKKQGKESQKKIQIYGISTEGYSAKSLIELYDNLVDELFKSTKSR